jgi:hypothetical protein
MSSDWTRDEMTGRSNSSPLFCFLVEEVERLIKDDAHALIRGRADKTARLIMAHLAHEHGLAPVAAKTEGKQKRRRVVA